MRRLAHISLSCIAIVNCIDCSPEWVSEPDLTIELPDIRRGWSGNHVLKGTFESSKYINLPSADCTYEFSLKTIAPCENVGLSVVQDHLVGNSGCKPVDHATIDKFTGTITVDNPQKVVKQPYKLQINLKTNGITHSKEITIDVVCGKKSTTVTAPNDLLLPL